MSCSPVPDVLTVPHQLECSFADSIEGYKDSKRPATIRTPRISSNIEEMAKFNLDEYYAEQEERINLPDETVEEYLKRIASFNRRFV